MNIEKTKQGTLTLGRIILVYFAMVSAGFSFSTASLDEKVSTTVDAFEPALGASFMAAHFGSLLAIYHSSDWGWDLLLSIPLVWVITFFLSLFVTYPVYLLLTPLYIRLSHRLSFILFVFGGLLIWPCFTFIANRISKIGINENFEASQSIEGMMVVSSMCGCISIAAWYRARKYEKRVVESEFI